MQIFNARGLSTRIRLGGNLPPTNANIGYLVYETGGTDSQCATAPLNAKATLRSDSAFADGRTTNEIRFPKNNGEWAWVEVAGSNQLHNEAVAANVTNFRDITQRNAWQAEL